MFNPLITIQHGSDDAVEVPNTGEFAFTLGATGGCLGGSLKLAVPAEIKADYAYQLGDEVLAYFDRDDEATLVYAGYVSGRKRQLRSGVHEYSIDGNWQRFASVALSGNSGLGSQSVEHPTVNTAGKAVQWLMAGPVAGAATGIGYSSDNVVAGKALAELRLRPAMPVHEQLHKLAYMASAAGSIVVPGVDQDKNFFFKPIPTDVVQTLTIGVDISDCEESDPEADVSNNIAIKGDVVPTKGYVAKASYSQPIGLPQRTRLIKLAGIYRQADLDNFAEGYFARHCDVTAQKISGVKSWAKESFPAFPWAGKWQLLDADREVVAETYVSQLDVVFGSTCTYSVTFGLSAGDGADPYAPSVLDEIAGGSPDNLLADEFNDPDVSDVYPDEGAPVGGEEDYPHLDGPLIDAEGGGGGGPTVGVGALGTIYDLEVPHALYVGDNCLAFALIANGGEALPETALCTFYFKAFNVGTALSAATIVGDVLRSANGIDTWVSHETYTVPAGATNVFVSALFNAGTEGATDYWYPADFSTSENYTKGAELRVIGSSENIYLSQTFYVGWAVDGS